MLKEDVRVLVNENGEERLGVVVMVHDEERVNVRLIPSHEDRFNVRVTEAPAEGEAKIYFERHPIVMSFAQAQAIVQPPGLWARILKFIKFWGS